MDLAEKNQELFTKLEANEVELSDLKKKQTEQIDLLDVEKFKAEKAIEDLNEQIGSLNSQVKNVFTFSTSLLNLMLCSNLNRSS